MKKIKSQLLILLAAAIVAVGELPYNPNLNNLNNPGENPISTSDSAEKEDNSQDNDGKNTEAYKQDCDKEEDKLSK